MNLYSDTHSWLFYSHATDFLPIMTTKLHNFYKYFKSITPIYLGTSVSLVGQREVDAAPFRCCKYQSDSYNNYN